MPIRLLSEWPKHNLDAQFRTLNMRKIGSTTTHHWNHTWAQDPSNKEIYKNIANKYNVRLLRKRVEVQSNRSYCAQLWFHTYFFAWMGFCNRKGRNGRQGKCQRTHLFFGTRQSLRKTALWVIVTFVNPNLIQKRLRGCKTWGGSSKWDKRATKAPK